MGGGGGGGGGGGKRRGGGGGGGGGGGEGLPQVGTGAKWKYFLNLSQKIDIDFHFQNAEF